MLKVIYKSVLYKSILSFIGLISAGWGVQLLTGLLFHNIHKPVFLALMNMTLFQYIPWILLAIGYAYALYMLFRKEKHMRLIMCLNGFAVFLQFYYLSVVLKVSAEDVMYLSVMLSDLTFFSVLVSAFIFKNISLAKLTAAQHKIRSKPVNVLIILIKSALCFLLLAVISQIYNFLIHNDSLLFRIFGLFGFMLESPYFIFPLAAIFYAFFMYKLLRRYTYRRLIMIINALFLIALYILDMTLYILPVLPFFDPLPFEVVSVNTGIVTLVLVIIFGKINKLPIISDKELKIPENISPAYPRPNL